MPTSLGPDWLELITVCPNDGFKGWFELLSECAERGPGRLTPVRGGRLVPSLNGSTWPRKFK